MLNIGMLELVLVLAVAFLIVGPKDLPKVARWLARQIRSLKKLVREIKKETGWDEFAKEFRDITDDVKSTVKDADVSKDVQAAADDLRGTVESVRREVDQASRELEKDIEV